MWTGVILVVRELGFLNVRSGSLCTIKRRSARSALIWPEYQYENDCVGAGSVWLLFDPLSLPTAPPTQVSLSQLSASRGLSPIIHNKDIKETQKRSVLSELFLHVKGLDWRKWARQIFPSFFYYGQHFFANLHVSWNFKTFLHVKSFFKKFQKINKYFFSFFFDFFFIETEVVDFVKRNYFSYVTLDL